MTKQYAQHKPSGLFVAPNGRVARIRLPVSGRDIDSGDDPHLTLSWDDGSEFRAPALSCLGDTGEAPADLFLELTASSEDFRLGLKLLDDPFAGGLLQVLSVTNHRPVPLARIEYTLLSASGIPDDWFCTLPFGGGWAVRLADFDPGITVSLRYPVQGCLQWIALFDSRESIACGTRDPAPWLKDFVIHRTETGITVSVIHRHLRIRQGESVELPPFVAGAHAGDWQSPAAVYARWLESVVTEPAVAPEWLQDAPAWAWGSGKGQYAEHPDSVFADLPDYSRRVMESGVRCVQLAAWVEHGHDTRYPDYVAAPSLGGEEGMRQAVEQIHREGRKMALYTNGRLLDPLSDTAASHPGWSGWAVTAPRGKALQDSIASEFVGVTTDVPLPDWDPHDRLAKEIYGKVVFATMCPSSPEWQEVFVDRLRYAAREYGVDGLYVDQVLGAVAVPCFAENHSHSKPYEAWMGYHDLLAAQRKAVKSVHPEAYLATEGFSDILSQYFDIVQSHNDWPGPCPAASFQLPEMTRHSVPWLLQAAGPVREDQFEMLRLVHITASGLDLACFHNLPSGAFGRQVRLVMEWRERFGKQMYTSRPIPAWIDGFPGRRATALLGEMLIICCGSLDWVQDCPMRINVPATGFIEPGVTLHWESTDAKGEVTLAAGDEGRLEAVVPPADMAMLWGGPTEKE